MMAAEEASAEHISRAKTPGEVHGIKILVYLVTLRTCKALNEAAGVNCLIPYYHPTSPFHGNMYRFLFSYII